MKFTFLGAALLGAPLWAQLPPEIPNESVRDAAQSSVRNGCKFLQTVEGRGSQQLQI